jgi:glycosyltransferase involved in cell wall biosynthesis
MKDGLFVSIFIPSKNGLGGGGAEQVVLNLAQGFVDRGFRTQVVLLKTTGVFMQKLSPKLEVIDLKFESKDRFFNLKKLWTLIKYFRREKPDVFFSVSDTDNIAMLAKKISRANTSVVTVLEICLSDPLSWMKSSIKRILTLRSYHYVDGIVACSQGVAEDLVSLTGLDPKRIKVIYNPIDISYIIKKSQEPANTVLSTESKVPFILGVGRLVKQKDFITLIKAFSIVRSHKLIKLFIVGEGEMRPELQSLIKVLHLEQDVEMLGFQINPYVYMRNASLFVLSSIYEGFGNVIVEAMAVGTPVVSTNCKSGPSEILDNGKYGKLVSIRNPEVLADAILNALDTFSDSKALQQRARDFDIDLITDQYVKLALGMRSKMF